MLRLRLSFTLFGQAPSRLAPAPDDTSLAHTSISFRFKLHIRPKDGSTADITSKIPPLPVGKTVVQVVADYLKYLFDCAASYIKDTHANGQDLWLSVQNDIDFVLSHPNGWEGYQQTQIRQAVVSAGLVPDTTAGHGRVSFISEGEASLYFAIQHGLPNGTLEVRPPRSFVMS